MEYGPSHLFKEVASKIGWPKKQEVAIGPQTGDDTFFIPKIFFLWNHGSII